MPLRGFRGNAGASLLAITGLLFLLIGGVIATVFCWGLPTDIAIERRLLAVNGDVVAVEMAEGVRINRRQATRVRYRYVVAGQSYDDDLLTIDKTFLQAVRQPGARVALEVDSAAPQRVRVAGGTHSSFGWFGALTLIVPLIGVGLLGVATTIAVRGTRRRRT